MSALDWHFAIAVIAFAAIYAWCKHLDERDEEIDGTEFTRLRGWASLIIAGVVGLVYLGLSIYGNRWGRMRQSDYLC
jgi:nicotinamide riboside transporter PnuC